MKEASKSTLAGTKSYFLISLQKLTAMQGRNLRHVMFLSDTNYGTNNMTDRHTDVATARPCVGQQKVSPVTIPLSGSKNFTGVAF